MADEPLEAETLIAMARTRSSARRNELALAMMDLFHDGHAILTERERIMMTDILRRLLHEVETAVRRRVATKLADIPDAPHSLVVDLANDAIDVAWPILKNSMVLEDIDLIEIVRTRSLEHKLAVSQRGVLSETVADALVHTDEASVIVSLLKNQNARLSQATMEYLVEQSRRVDDFQEPLLRRNELTLELAGRMYAWVSAALREHIVAHFPVPATVIDDALEATMDDMQALPEEVGKDEALALEIERAGMIRPSMIREAVAAGQVSLYSVLVERMTGVRRQLATRMLFEPAGEGLAVLCRAVDLPQRDFLDIYTISRKARPNDSEEIAKACQRLGAFYHDLTSDAARAVVIHWRRNPNYLAALREIQKAKGYYG